MITTIAVLDIILAFALVLAAAITMGEALG